jgi:hypothetical protein
MHVTRWLLSIIFFAAPAGAFAGTAIDETVDAGTAGLIDIENIVGTVTIMGTDDGEVRVRGRLSDAASGLDVRRDGSRIIVHVEYPENFGRGTGRVEDTNLEISAPRGLDVEIDTVSASISVSGMQGDQDLNSVSGSIDTMLYASEIRAKTVSGGIGIDGSDERTRAYASSVSGRIELESVSGEVTAETVSGRIRLRSNELERAELNSVSGAIDVDARLTSDSRLRTATTSGRISLLLNDSPAGRYELSSFSGSIDNCFGPAASKPQFGPPSAQLQFEEPDADTQVFANSMSGSIEICR